MEFSRLRRSSGLALGSPTSGACSRVTSPAPPSIFQAPRFGKSKKRLPAAAQLTTNSLGKRELAASLAETVSYSPLIRNRFEDLRRLAVKYPDALANVSEEEIRTLIMNRFFQLALGRLAKTKPGWALRTWEEY